MGISGMGVTKMVVTGMVVTGMVVTGMAGVVAGITVVTAAGGSWPRDRSRRWSWTSRGSAGNGSLLQWLRLQL
jgi:hypothetical protein